MFNKIDLRRERRATQRIAQGRCAALRWKAPVVHNLGASSGEGCRDVTRGAWTSSLGRREEGGRMTAMHRRRRKTLVVKVGSSLVTNDGRGPRPRRDRALGRADRRSCAQLGKQMRAGVERRDRRGHAAPGLDAAPARACTSCRPPPPSGRWASCSATRACFREHGLHTAQVLLTHDDLADRQRYLNARSTLRTLLALGVIPVINENDTVATDEIRSATTTRSARWSPT